MVGIFWLIETAEGVSLITHNVMLDIAEEYGDCLTSPVNHYDAWEATKTGRLLLAPLNPATRRVIAATEYEAWPRGRVVFDKTRPGFIVYADRQAFSYAGLICQRFSLPENTKFQADLHYRNTRRMPPYHSGEPPVVKKISLNIPLHVENSAQAKWPRRIKARPRIQRAFDFWYRANQNKFLIQLNFIWRCDASIRFGFAGINQIISAAVSLDDLNVYVTWQGECWDMLISLDTSPARVLGGYVCTMCAPETRPTLTSREAVWETDLFEPLLQWVNERLAPANALHISGDDGFTSARLVVKDGDPNIEQEYDRI